MLVMYMFFRVVVVWSGRGLERLHSSYDYDAPPDGICDILAQNPRECMCGKRIFGTCAHQTNLREVRGMTDVRRD